MNELQRKWYEENGCHNHGSRGWCGEEVSESVHFATKKKRRGLVFEGVNSY